MTRSEKWHALIKIVAIVAPFGFPLGLIPGYFLSDGSLRSVLAGGMIGLLIGFGMVSFDVSWSIGLFSRKWREAPFLVVLVTRSLVYLAIIVFGITAPLVLVTEIPITDVFDASFATSVAISFLIALVINFIGQVNRLLGRGVLVSLIIGRYHRPREEVRVFLLIDLRQSSQIAEQLGNLRYHAFLKRFIDDVSAAAMRFGGEIHRYVGDEVILTWEEEKGIAKANCVNCMFAITDAIAVAYDQYMTEFGVVPSTWAGLHIGPVVTGDVGTIKHEIVHLGDTINVAARIEQACREFERTFLASADVIDALTLPAAVETERLGAIDLRGIGSSVELVAVSRDS